MSLIAPQDFPIVMADDDPDDQLLTRDAFQEFTSQECLGFANDGEELLALLKRCDTLPRLILLDWNMPRKNGHETLLALRANQALSQIPVVVLTTSTDPSDVEAATQAGAVGFMTKPLTFEGLQEFAKEMVRRYAPEVLV